MSAQKIDENHTPETATKWISIIQITRIGDILQTAQAIRLLKLNHQNIKVQLIARKQFAEPIRFIIDQVFDECICLDLKSSINLKNGVAGSIADIQNQIANINKRPISASINLSFSKTSKYLHSLVKSQHKIGPYYTTTHTDVIEDKWSQYLYATVMRGDLNPFNLVDLFANIIGVKKAQTFLSTKEYSKDKKTNILIHPFASHDKKMWPESKWTEVIYNIFKNNPATKLHIVGARADQEKMNKILNSQILANYKSNIYEHLGKPLEDIYSMVDENFLFVGHDSMVSHLLSFKNVKSLTVSFGTTRIQETAPYSLNSYIVSPTTNCYPCFPNDNCSMFQCQTDVPYQTVSAIINQLMLSNTLNIDSLRAKVTDLNLTKVNINMSSTNNLGQLTLKNLNRSEKNIKDTFRDFYNVIWSYTFTQLEPEMPTPALGNMTKAALNDIKKPVENLYELAEFGKKYSRFIIEEISNNTPNLKSIKSYSLKIDEIDRLLDILSTASPLLSPIVDYAKVAKSNLYGGNIVELTESAFYIYQEISNTTSIIYDFITKIAPKTSTPIKLARKDA